MVTPAAAVTPDRGIQGDKPILVVDDSPATLEVIRRNLEDDGHRVVTAPGVAEALEVLERTPVLLVITDVKTPQISGLDLVRHVRDHFKHLEVIVITGCPNVAGAVAAMKNGATDYITKPFTGDELLDAVRRASANSATRDGDGDGDADRPVIASHGLLGHSPAMLGVFEKIQRAARTRATTLVCGESGTGKELVARAIHYESQRAPAPFVPVNCGAIPEELFESELFGHLKGAFTGATETRAGFFLTADGGTVFLDEIAETSLAMQVKLLRVLQDKEVRMVGSSRTTNVDVRVIAATNKDLEQLVRRGAFREDLFFRVNVLVVEVPPLRDRGADIALLVDHFAASFAEEVGQPQPTFTERALELLGNHAWPGNVRELENLVQRMVVMADGDTIDAADLPKLLRFSASAGHRDINRTLAQVEAEHVRAVLDNVGGNKTRAAQVLGIDRKTLRSKMQASEDAPPSKVSPNRER